ncbi:MAG: nucleoside triphosphate pyrophosphohydrolase family protein [Alphaproteobacteria bacterium]|nr:nucleoside triphosphate pyrophosphohydrolase family protein [Alphaproteobacteria bacterium]
MTNYEKVRELHKKFNLPLDLGMLPESQAAFRLSLMEGEFNELKKAIADNDLLNILEEITDVLYSVYGTAAEYGFDVDEAFARLHASNMSKDPPLTPGGKLVKGPNFKPKDMTDLA